MKLPRDPQHADKGISHMQAPQHELSCSTNDPQNIERVWDILKTLGHTQAPCDLQLTVKDLIHMQVPQQVIYIVYIGRESSHTQVL